MERGEGEKEVSAEAKGQRQEALAGSLVVVLVMRAGKGGRGHNAMRKEATQ